MVYGVVCSVGSEFTPKYTPITGTAKIATLANPVTANMMSAALDWFSMFYVGILSCFRECGYYHPPLLLLYHNFYI